MRSVMRACIGSNRAPDGRYAEIDLPASPYRLLNALDEIGIKSTKEIVYQETLTLTARTTNGSNDLRLPSHPQ